MDIFNHKRKHKHGFYGFEQIVNERGCKKPATRAARRKIKQKDYIDFSRDVK